MNSSFDKMSLMPLSDYKRIMTSLFATVAATLLLSIGSVIANHFNTKFQVKANKTAIENIKEESSHFVSKNVSKVEREAFERRVTVVEGKQDEIIKLLIRGNAKVNVVNNAGQSSLDMAFTEKRTRSQ